MAREYTGEEIAAVLAQRIALIGADHAAAISSALAARREQRARDWGEWRALDMDSQRWLLDYLRDG